MTGMRLRAMTLGQLALVAGGIVFGCGGGALPTATPGPVPTPTPEATPTAVAPTPTLAISSTPVITPVPVPQELQGAWRTVLGDETVSLKIFATQYSVHRPPEGAVAGSIRVDGNTVTFSRSTACQGVGMYTYQINEQQRLTFSLISEQCSGRQQVLVDQVYEREP